MHLLLCKATKIQTNACERRCKSTNVHSCQCYFLFLHWEFTETKIPTQHTHLQQTSRAICHPDNRARVHCLTCLKTPQFDFIPIRGLILTDVYSVKHLKFFWWFSPQDIKAAGALSSPPLSHSLSLPFHSIASNTEKINQVPRVHWCEGK